MYAITWFAWVTCLTLHAFFSCYVTPFISYHALLAWATRYGSCMQWHAMSFISSKWGQACMSLVSCLSCRDKSFVMPCMHVIVLSWPAMWCISRTHAMTCHACHSWFHVTNVMPFMLWHVTHACYSPDVMLFVTIHVTDVMSCALRKEQMAMLMALKVTKSRYHAMALEE